MKPGLGQGAITTGDNAIFYVGNLRCEPGGFGRGLNRRGFVGNCNQTTAVGR
jgi:hypothetical protein